MEKKITKVPVSRRAITQRINRVLRGQNRTLRVVRESSKQFEFLGAYYILDGKLSEVYEAHVDLEILARKLGVLEAYEEVN